MVELVHAAKIVERKGVQEWRCQNCNQKLGEIRGMMVIVKAGPREIRFPTPQKVIQVCPCCGVASVLQHAS